jgi:hypothetical protein
VIPLAKEKQLFLIDILLFIMVFNTPSACGGVIPLNMGPGLALGFNTFYLA